MKKMLSFIAVLALLILPLKVSAAGATYSHEVLGPDANGTYTAVIYATVSQGTSFPGFNGKLVGTNAILESIQDTDLFKVDTANTTQEADGKSAQVKTVYSNPNATSLDAAEYVGTGEKVEILKFTYKHDSTASADDDCYFSYIPDGVTNYQITPKKTTNPKTGSVLPYVGIIAGIGLIGCAYVISKKSTKLYRM